MISLYVIAALVWCIWYVKLILIWRGPTCQAGIVEKKDKRYIYVNCWHRPEWCELQCIWKQSLHFIPIYVECIYNIECFCKWNAYDNQDTSDNAFSSSITNQLLHVYIFNTSNQYCFIDHQVTATCANPEKHILELKNTVLFYEIFLNTNLWIETQQLHWSVVWCNRWIIFL